MDCLRSVVLKTVYPGTEFSNGATRLTKSEQLAATALQIPHGRIKRVANPVTDHIQAKHRVGMPLLSDQAQLARTDRGLGAVLNAQFVEDSGYVVLYRPLREAEPLSDLAVGQAAGQQIQDFMLTLR